MSHGPGSGSLGTALVESPTGVQADQPTFTSVLAPPSPGSALASTVEAAQRGSLSIRDFGFPTHDPRHRGHGSVLPAPHTEPMYTALYDFTAESSNELSVSAGTQVHLLRPIDAGWVLAQLVGDASKRGLVPEAYLQKT